MKRALTILFLCLLLANAFAVIQSDSIKVFAVTDNGTAMTADLMLEIKPGTGHVWTSVEPLVGTSTQSTQKIAVETARSYTSLVDQYDYFFEIKSDASLVDGPSAGAAMTLLAVSMLQDRRIPDNVSLTGTITSGGGVGPVGGVFEKSKEAARIGMDLFMIPLGEARQTVRIDDQVQSVNLVQYAQDNWGMKIVEVAGIDDVLEYAYSDIENIDINAGVVSAVEFVPDRIELPSQLSPMKTLTGQYIASAEDSIRSAKTALSGTLLDEPEVIDALLTTLNESEKTLAQAKILDEQNYLYSAANYAFLAKVNAQFVNDIAENPALLSRASTAFGNELDQLDRKVSVLEQDLNRYVSVDFFEWQLAAKERLSWARLKLNQLMETKGTLVISENNGIDLDRVAEIMDYEYALAWYEASEDFAGLSRESQRAVALQPVFAEYIDSYIANAENSLSAMDEAETADIRRRIDGAKISRGNGWYHSALVDSASALALSNAVVFSKNKGLDELQAALLAKIEEVEGSMESSGRGFVWAKLYLDHARYYLKSSLFYEERGQMGTSLNAASSGVELAFLAEAVFQSTDASYSYFDLLPSESFVSLGGNILPSNAIETVLIWMVAALVLVGVILVLGIAASGRKVHVLKAFTFDDMMDEILEGQKRLRQRLDRGHITKEQFDSLNKPIQQKLNRLLADRNAMSAEYISLDLNKCKMAAFERALRDLKVQQSRKEITPKDFGRSAEFYRKKIALLKLLVSECRKKLKEDKSKAQDDFSAK